MFKKTLALVGLTLSLHSNAALIDNGFYVTDTDTQTDYLKLSVTLGHSYNDVVVNDNLGLILAGWTLTSDLSLINVDSNYSNAFDLITDNGGDAVAVITDESSVAGQPFLPSSISYGAWWESGDVELAFNTWGADDTDPLLAVSLSRVVPVPAAAWLFGSALIGLVGIGRNRKKAA